MRRFANFNQEVAKVKNKIGAYSGVTSESFLRAEELTIDGQGTYTFDFKQSKGNKKVTEQLLNENDLFRVLGIRFFMLSAVTTNPVIAVPQTYPNVNIFTTETADSPAGTFDAAHLEAFYNAGYLSYKKGDTTYIKALSLRDSRFVSQTQQSSATNKSSTELASPGMLVLSQPFNIIGTDLGELSINVPSPANLKIQYSTSANAGKRIYLAVQLEGILFSGGNKISTASAQQLMAI